MAGISNVEADELSKKNNDDLEWALDADIFQEIVDRFGKPDLIYLHQDLIINLRSMFHSDQIQMQWLLMLFPCLGLNNMYIFLHLSAPSIAPSIWFYGK